MSVGVHIVDPRVGTSDLERDHLSTLVPRRGAALGSDITVAPTLFGISEFIHVPACANIINPGIAATFPEPGHWFRGRYWGAGCRGEIPRVPSTLIISKLPHVSGRVV